MVERLREVRLAKGLTQFDLAKRSNINPSDISKIENGIITKPYKKWREALAKALDVQEEILFPEVSENASKAE